jgi:hypothetical protein
MKKLTSTEFFLASALFELAHLAADPSKMILVAYLISFVLEWDIPSQLARRRNL